MKTELILFHQDFKSWLETHNYSTSTINHAVATLKDFTLYLENKQITELKQISALSLHTYFRALKSRRNKRRGGGLSANYLNKRLGDLKLFQRFLQEKYSFYLPLKEKPVKAAKPLPEVLTVEEVKSLYNACELSEPLGYRDRAILSLYYGAGLRRSEGINLEIKDLNLDARTIHIKKAKNGHERLVPIPIKVMQDLREYLLTARPVLKQLNPSKCQALLLSRTGKALTGDDAYERLKHLQELSSIESIHLKEIGLHTLRHSYATHLLKNGLRIEQIAKLLGHRSIVSTQVYTHLI